MIFFSIWSWRNSLPLWIIMWIKVTNIWSWVTFAAADCSFIVYLLDFCRRRRINIRLHTLLPSFYALSWSHFPSLIPYSFLCPSSICFSFPPSLLTPSFPSFSHPLLTFLGLFLCLILDAWPPSRLARQGRNEGRSQQSNWGKEKVKEWRRDEGRKEPSEEEYSVITMAPSGCWEAEITSDFEVRGSNTASVAIVTGSVCVCVCVCLCKLLGRFIMHDPHCD